MATSRRDFLKAAALLAGGAGVGGVVPESVKRAFAIEPAPGSTYRDAEHVVILMQENRSFDHALGSLQGVRGFNDPRAIRQANGNSVFAQTSSNGETYAPWRLDIKDTKITWMGSIPHSRNSQVDAWNEGHYDQWIDAKRSHNAEYMDVPITMGHYTREDLPFYYALADAFTVCDQSFCSGMTSTTPNRCFFWTGTVRDEQNTSSRVFMRNDEIMVGGQTWKTFPERLQDAGVSWKFYQNELSRNTGFTEEQDAWLGNFGLNIMESFAAYNIAAYPYAPASLQQDLDKVKERLPMTRKALEQTKDPQLREKLRQKIKTDEMAATALTKQLANGTGSELYAKMTPAERALHNAAFVTNAGDSDYRSLEPLSFEGGTMNVPKGDVLYQFREDVKNGKLPTVSWLGSPEHFSDHPTSPWYGAWYVSEVMDILTQNPEVWKKTIFILTYDENDGYFDHVPSFAAADPKRPWTGRASDGIDTGLEYMYVEDELRQGVDREEARTGPIGMGFRVPTIVASPWSRGGWVNSQLFDHTSTLQFLEGFLTAKAGKEIRETNISPWRRAIAGDLTSCFRPHTEKEAKLKYLNRDKFVVQIREAQDKEVPSNYVNLNTAQIADVNMNLAASQYMPKQEPGTRSANALPYELYADGDVSADGSRFELTMRSGNVVHGLKSIGAPFNVYARRTKNGQPEMVAGTYVVKAGDSMTQGFPLSWFPDGKFEIEVNGPNGFYRRFAGVAKSPLEVKATYERRARRLSGNMQLGLKNGGGKPLQVVVTDHSYGQRPVRRTVAVGESTDFVLALADSHGWYDFSVSTEGEPTSLRYAGRVETGESSRTDPIMGRA